MSRPVNIFLRAKRALNEVERLDAKAGRLHVSDFRSIADYLKAKRSSARKRELNALAPASVCPICGQTKLGTRRWVVLKAARLLRCTVKLPVNGPKVAVCRGCAMKEGLI